MAVQEEVVVNLKIQGQGFDKTINIMQKVAKGATAIETVFKAVTEAAVGLGVSILKMQAFLRGFILIAPETVKGVKEIKTGMSVLTNQFNNVAIPTIKAFTKLLGPFAAAAVVAAGAVSLIGRAMKTSSVNAFNAQFATNLLNIAWGRLLENVVPLADALSNLWTGMLLQLGLVSWSMTILAAQMAKWQLSLVDLEIAQTKQLSLFQTQLIDVNVQLKSNQLLEEDRIKLLMERGRLEAAIALVELESLETRKRILNESLRGELTHTDRVERELEITKLQLAIDLARARSIAAVNTALIRVNNIINDQTTLVEEQTVAIELWGEALRKAGIEVTEFVTNVETPEGLISAGTGFYETFIFGPDFESSFGEQQATVERLFIGGLERIKKIDVSFDEDKKRRLENRANFEFHIEELRTSGALEIAKAASNLGRQLAADDFEAQKGFAVAGAVVDTAAGIAGVWRNPGYPLAIPLSVAVALNGAAQIAAIQAAQPGQGTVVNPIITAAASTPIETASPDFFRSNQSRPQTQAVLVTEDLDTVQGRIAVTDSLSSIGG